MAEIERVDGSDVNLLSGRLNGRALLNYEEQPHARDTGNLVMRSMKVSIGKKRFMRRHDIF